MRAIPNINFNIIVSQFSSRGKGKKSEPNVDKKKNAAPTTSGSKKVSTAHRQEEEKHEEPRFETTVK